MSVLIFVQRQEYRWQLHCCCFYYFPNLSKFGAAEKTKTTVQLSWMWLLIILATYSSPNKIIVVDTPHPFLMAFWKYSVSGRKGRQAGGYSTPSQIYLPAPGSKKGTQESLSLCSEVFRYSTSKVRAPQWLMPSSLNIREQSSLCACATTARRDVPGQNFNTWLPYCNQIWARILNM